MPKFSVELPPDLIVALVGISQRERLPPEALIHEAISRDLRRRDATLHEESRDVRTLSGLRAYLANDFACALGWDDLQTRLQGKGYELAEIGGALCLLDDRTHQKVAKLSELGYTARGLRRQFALPYSRQSQRINRA